MDKLFWELSDALRDAGRRDAALLAISKNLETGEKSTGVARRLLEDIPLVSVSPDGTIILVWMSGQDAVLNLTILPDGRVEQRDPHTGGKLPGAEINQKWERVWKRAGPTTYEIDHAVRCSRRNAAGKQCMLISGHGGDCFLE